MKIHISIYLALDCIGSLGVESGHIFDSQMSATSQKSQLSGAKHARIGRRKTINVQGETDSEGGWIPSSSSHSQHLQIDIGRKVKITAVETQGADQTKGDQRDYWVKTYQLQYSVDGGSWSTVPQVCREARGYMAYLPNVDYDYHHLEKKAMCCLQVKQIWWNVLG